MSDIEIFNPGLAGVMKALVSVFRAEDDDHAFDDLISKLDEKNIDEKRKESKPEL